MPTITESLVRRARAKEREYELSCSSLRGFVLRVLPSGKKVYYARHKRRGRDTRERIGPADELSLEVARRRAAQILHGPAATPEAPARRVSPRLREFAARFDREHIEPYLKPKTRRQLDPMGQRGRRAAARLDRDAPRRGARADLGHGRLPTPLPATP